MSEDITSVFESKEKHTNYDTVNRLVSVIVPAHNAEKWINRCIDSILKQTYELVEAIVVENGSTDNTQLILDSYRDERVKIFCSTPGVSNARNLGIEKASGEYLCFLDADDWLATDAIKRMIGQCDDRTDIVTARYYADEPLEKYEKKKYDMESDEFVLKCLYNPTKRGNVTGNLYRTAFVKNNHVQFNTELTHAEDSVFFFTLLQYNPVILDLEQPVYYVFANPDSATRGNSNVDAFRKSVTEIYKLFNFSSEHRKNASYIFALNQLLIIFVHSGKTGKKQAEFVKMVCNIDVFAEAIERSDLSAVFGVKRILFQFLKFKFYLPIVVACSVRASKNAAREMKT